MARNTAEDKIVPSGPFAAWLNTYVADRLRGQLFPDMKSTQDSILKGLCELLGWVNWDAKDPFDAGLRRVYRYRRQISESNTGTLKYVRGPRIVKHVEFYDRHVVEDALHHAGVPFEDLYPRGLYPALYVDIPLEPEMFCAGCQDHCTPIHGVCPWCEGTILIPNVPRVDEMKKAA
jgi:hypothetical protein